MSATAHTVWDHTYQNGTVPANVAVENIGTVFGTIHVSRGGWLRHRGFAGRIEVEAGGHVVMEGMVGRIEAQQASDVVYIVDGREIPATPGENPGDPPFTGPAGWGQLNDLWASCVRGIDEVIRAAHLEQAATQEVGEDPALVLPYMVSFGPMSATDMSDLRMWALLSATVLNRNDDLAVPPNEAWAWSPAEYRELVKKSGQTHRFLTEPPWLLSTVADMAPPEAGRLALSFYDAMWPLAAGIVAIGDPPGPATQAGLASFRKVLNDEVLRAKAKESEQPAAEGPPPRGRSHAPRPATESAADAEPEVSSEKSGALDVEERPVQSALVELEALIGLQSVKKEIETLGAAACLFRERQRRRLKVPEPVRHMIMMGNPGTGKTTVARLLGQIYHGYGLLPRRSIREVHRTDLVANIIGDTDKKTRKVFMDALGGVLFIDEAYMLTPRGAQDFGQEAIDELNHLMEDHRDEIMVVIAGYPEKIEELLGANPGLEGRFGPKIEFPDYSNDELLEILLKAFVWNKEYELSDEAEDACRMLIKQARGMMGPRFDNARMVRRLFERATLNQGARLRAKAGDDTRVRKLDDDELLEILAEDLPTAAQVAQRPDEDALSGSVVAPTQQGAEEQKHAAEDEQPCLADVGVELEQRKDNDEPDQPPRVAYQEPHGAADHAVGPSEELPEKRWKEWRAVADQCSVIPDGDMEAVSAGRIATVQAEAGDVADDGACADPPAHADARRLKLNVVAAGGGEGVDAAAVRRRASAAPGGYGNR